MQGRQELFNHQLVNHQFEIIRESLMPSHRSVFLIIALFCGGLIATALYMQHVMGLNPCYLCIVQRVFVILTGLIATVAFIHNPGTRGLRIYSGLTLAGALGGGGFSIRQLWLQSLPEDLVPACGPPADYLFDAFPLTDALSMLLRGDGNCAEIQWTLFGLSIPAWTLMAFVTIASVSLWQLLRKN